MWSNGNSFSALGECQTGIGTERAGRAEQWMFPGADSGIQRLCNPL